MQFRTSNKFSNETMYEMDKLIVTILAVVIALASAQDLNINCGRRDFKCVGISQYLSCADYGDGDFVIVGGTIQTCPHDKMCNELDEEPCLSEMVPESTTSTAPTSTADPATLKDDFEHTEPIGAEDNAELAIAEGKSVEESAQVGETVKQPFPFIEDPVENINNEEPIAEEKDSHVGEQELAEEQFQTEAVAQETESLSETDYSPLVEIQNGNEDIDTPTASISDTLIEENTEAEIEAVDEQSENETVAGGHSFGEEVPTAYSENKMLTDDISAYQAPTEEPLVLVQNQTETTIEEQLQVGAFINKEPEQVETVKTVDGVEIIDATETDQTIEEKVTGSKEEETKKSNSDSDGAISTSDELVEERAEINEDFTSEIKEQASEIENVSTPVEEAVVTEQYTDVQAENNKTSKEDIEQHSENKEYSVAEDPSTSPISAESKGEEAAQKETTDETIINSQEFENPSEKTSEKIEASVADKQFEVNEFEVVAAQNNEGGGAAVTSRELEENSSVEVTQEAQSSEDITNIAGTETSLLSSAVYQTKPTTTSEVEINEAIESSETTTASSEEGEITLAEGTNDERELGPTNTIPPCTAPGAHAYEGDCKRYFICLGSSLGYYRIEATCPPQFAFSARKMRCTRDIAPCGGLKCEATGNIADSEDPTKYFWCVPSMSGEYQKYHIQCPTFQRFHPVLAKCSFDPNHLVAANHEVIETEEDEHTILKVEKEWLKQEEKRISSEEKRLEKDKKRREKAVKDQLKDLEKEEKRRKKAEEKARKQQEKLCQKLNSKNEGNVSADIKENGSLFTCTEEGTFPDPGCCEKYIICWETNFGTLKMSRMKCPPDYFYDSERMICANDGMVKCAA